MNAIQRSIVRARRRIVLQRFVDAAGWMVLAGLAVGLALLLVDRSLPVFAVPLWGYGVIAGVALVVAVVLAWLGAPSVAATASTIDARLGLKDRIGTALWVESLASSTDDPFAGYVHDDAEKAAAEAQVNAAFPVKPGPVWHWALPAAAVVAVVGVFVGEFDALGLQDRVDAEQQADTDAAEVKAQIVEVKQLIEDMTAEDGAELAEADPSQILKELASLTNRDLRNPEMQRQTMAQLSNVQEKLAQNQQAKEQEFRSLQNQMSRLETGTNGPANRFADAMRRGDFDAAAKELQRLAEQIERGDLSESDKQLLQQQLQNMANQLQQMAQAAAAQQAQMQQAINQQLQQAGLSQQQVQQLQQQGYNQQAVQQALQQQYQQQGMNQQQAQQQAQQQSQQIAQQSQQMQQQGSQSQCSSGMSQSMSQMAQSLGQQGQQGQQSSQFSQGAWQGQQQLSQMAQMQQQVQQMQMAQSQLQQAMQQMGQQGQQGQGGSGQKPSPMSGTGGHKAGTGVGGNPIGQERAPGQQQAQASADIQDRQGRIIASWTEKGQNFAGDATVEFDQTITSARDDAERAVTEDRVPRRYHQAIKGYFNQLPEAADEARRAPAAPR